MVSAALIRVKVKKKWLIVTESTKTKVSMSHIKLPFKGMAVEGYVYFTLCIPVSLSVCKWESQSLSQPSGLAAPVIKIVSAPHIVS